MAEGDFSVFAKIQADTSNFEKGMKRAQTSANNLSNTFSNVSKIITKALSFAGLAVGTKAIVDFGKSCVQSANQATKQFNILDNTIKATGADAWTSTKEMADMAKTLSDSTNYSVTEIEKMQSVLLGFRDITGETFQDASDAVLDMATVMGMDLTSAVQTVGKALDDPIKGLDSLRRQGFAFTDEQKIELKQLVATGKKVEAQKIILEELATTYGGAAKASQDSFAKQRHAIENFRDSLGTKLIPMVKIFAEDNARMINSLRNLIENTDFTPAINVITNLKKRVSETFETISGYVKKIANEITDFISRFNFKPIISVIDTLAGVFISMFNKVKNNSGEMIRTFQTIKETLISFSNSETFQKIADGVNTILEALYFLWDKVETVATEIRKIVVDRIIEIWNKIKELFTNSQNALANSEGEIKSWADYFWHQFDNVFKIFQDLMNQISAIIHGDWAVAWEYAKLIVLRIIDSIVTGWDTLFRSFSDKIHKIITIASMASKVLPGIGIGGKAVVTALQGIEKLSSGIGAGNELIQKSIEETENKIEELSGHTADVSIRDLGKITEAFSGFTANVLGEIQNLTDGVETETEKQKDLYKNSAEDSEKEVSDVYNEWDAKLLQQKLNNMKEYGKEYSKEYLELTNKLINMERQKALESAETEEERAKINEYYDNEILGETERFEKGKREKAKQTMNIIIGYFKNIASKSVEIFKKVVSTLKDAFSAVANFIKNTFSGIKNIFEKLFDFNINDALDNLLKVEDAILTFFVETLPNLPSFFESAFSSVLVLVNTLMTSIDWDKVTNFLTAIVDTFVKYSPEIVSGIVKIFTNIVSSVSKVFIEKAPEVVESFGSMLFSIIDALPEIITNIISAIGSAISSIGKYISDNAQRLSDDLTNVVESLVDGISDFIKNGGWKNLLNGLLAIQKAIENAVADNLEEIVDTIVSMLPDLIDTLIASIVSASKTLAKIIKPIIRLILALIDAIIEVLTSDEVMDASIDAIMAIVEAIFDELLPGIIKLIPKLIVKVIAQIVKNLPKIVKALVEGLIKAFTKTNWIQVIKEIFIGFIDAFKDLFGIHSPSTLFEEFGTNMVEGLINGLRGITDAVNEILEPLYNLVENIFGSIGDIITDSIGSSFSGLVDILSTIGDILTGITEVASEGLVWIIEETNDGIIGITEAVTELVYALSDLIETASEAVDALNPLSGFGGGGSSGSGGVLDWLNPVSSPLSPWNWFADGSQSVPKGLAVVGEAGPELVKFRGGEQVLNNRNTNKALEQMGGTTINQNVTFNNLADTTAFAMMNQLKQYNRQMAINGVI